MPRLAHIPPQLAAVIAAQDGVVHRQQLTTYGYSRDAIRRRILNGSWQVLLPNVFLTTSGSPTRRQLLTAAHAWAGPASAVDGPDACAWYGVRPSWLDVGRVHLVTPLRSGLRTTGFVTVRRTVAEIDRGDSGVVPYVDPATALVVGARGAPSWRAAVDLLSRGLQARIVDLADLRRARESIGDKWCREVDSALVAVGVGIRSPAENDFRRAVSVSRVLPEPLWNQWLDLGDGGPPVCADALFVDAGLVHETNGSRHHAWGKQFEDMQTRHDRMTAAGLIVLHNAATRLRRDSDAVRREVEQTHALWSGRGMPARVRLIDDPYQLRSAAR